MVEQLAVAERAVTRLADFAGWMATEQRRVYLLCLRMLGDADDADTAAQDTFLKAYRALEKQDAAIDDMAKWVTRIAVNTCLDKRRSRRWQFWRKRPNQSDEEVILAMTPAAAPDAEEQFFSTEIGKEIHNALNRLSDRQRAVFTLRHFDGRSLDEIASLLGLDVGTVKAHMARAVAKLREDLKGLYALHHAGGHRR